MWAFNIVVTMASGGRYHHLMAELEAHGEFHRTEFLGVLLGRVADVADFLETVRAARELSVIAFQDLGRVVPVERTFTFRTEEFLERVCATVAPWAGELAGGRFYVRLERRGHKGQIVSPEAERAIDAFIVQESAKSGTAARVDFEDPDAVIAVETVGDRCGVGLLSRAQLERYDFVRVS